MARQKTTEMQDTEVKPPAAGSVVAGRDHPTVGTTGVGTVVGTADGKVVVVGGLVVGAEVVATEWRTRFACGEEQADTKMKRTRAAPAAARRPTATCPSE